MQQLQARFEGRVQGVGFRLTVAELAKNFQITGSVCNVADGSVDLIAEGEMQDLQAFHDAILQRMSRHVVDHHEVWRTVTQAAHADFSIGPDKHA